jgi:hypothetical protein
MPAAREIFIDATHNTSKTSSYLYGIVGNENGVGIPFGFMLMSVGTKEAVENPSRAGEAKKCNENFFAKAMELGLKPTWVHTDKDHAEISAAEVPRSS